MILMLDYLNYQLCQIYRLTILSLKGTVSLRYQGGNRWDDFNVYEGKFSRKITFYDNIRERNYN